MLRGSCSEVYGEWPAAWALGPGSWAQCYLPPWPFASGLTSLCLSFLLFKMELIRIAPCPRGSWCISGGECLQRKLEQGWYKGWQWLWCPVRSCTLGETQAREGFIDMEFWGGHTPRRKRSFRELPHCLATFSESTGRGVGCWLWLGASEAGATSGV